MDAEVDPQCKHFDRVSISTVQSLMVSSFPAGIFQNWHLRTIKMSCLYGFFGDQCGKNRYIHADFSSIDRDF